MSEIDDLELEGMGEAAEPESPSEPDSVEGAGETAADAPRPRMRGEAPEATSEPQAAQEPSEKIPGASQAPPSDPGGDLAHWRGRATAHWHQLQEATQALRAYRERYGTLDAPPAAEKPKTEAEKPPEYDPDNPAPYLKWQAEENARRTEALYNYLQNQEQYRQQAEVFRFVQAIDQDGASRWNQALGHVDGDPGDADAQSAYKYVMSRSLALLERTEPTPDEAKRKLIEHNIAWTRERLASGEDPIAALKAHAQLIGWQPGAAAAPAVPNGNGAAQAAARAAAAAKKPGTAVFRRPSTPRAGGVATGVPDIRRMQSEEEFFDALDSGLMSKADVQRQLQVVLPGLD